MYDHIQQGVLSNFKGKFQLLNGGRGRVIDTSPSVLYTIKYTAEFARPARGSKIVGKVAAINAEGGRANLIVTLEGNLTAIVKNVDETRFLLKEIDGGKSMESDSSSDSEDSVFEGENNHKTVFLFDQKKNKEVQVGSSVKLEITDVLVSEGILISSAKLI